MPPPRPGLQSRPRTRGPERGCVRRCRSGRCGVPSGKLAPRAAGARSEPAATWMGRGQVRKCPSLSIREDAGQEPTRLPERDSGTQHSGVGAGRGNRRSCRPGQGQDDRPPSGGRAADAPCFGNTLRTLLFLPLFSHFPLFRFPRTLLSPRDPCFFSRSFDQEKAHLITHFLFRHFLFLHSDCFERLVSICAFSVQVVRDCVITLSFISTLSAGKFCWVIPRTQFVSVNFSLSRVWHVRL